MAKYVIAANPLPTCLHFLVRVNNIASINYLVSSALYGYSSKNDTVCTQKYGVGRQLALFPPPSYILLMTLYNIVVTSKDCTKTLYIIIALLFI